MRSWKKKAMANYLSQFHTIKNSCDHLVIAVEDVDDLWPTVKSIFEEELPFKKAYLNNKTRNAVLVENLPAEFILTTDARLRSRFPKDQSLYWFREPYATIILVTCEDLDEFKTILKPRLKLLVQNDEEWFIIFVSRAHPSNDQGSKMAKKVYAKLEVDFSSKKRESIEEFPRLLFKVESATMDGERQVMIFKSSIALQRPVLDPCMAVGFFPLPDSGLRVGQLITIKSRIERLKDLDESDNLGKNNDEILYEVVQNSVNWMIAGRKRGFISLSNKQGSRMVVSILCLPLVSGYVHPPQLQLPDVAEGNISCNPAGPHLVCVFPRVLSSSYCIPA